MWMRNGSNAVSARRNESVGTSNHLSSGSEAGFSLVEIVIAMFVLAALSLALVPALIAGLKQSSQNAILATASGVLTARLDAAQAQAKTCTAISTFVASTVPNFTESHGVTLHVTQSIDACPSAYPGTVALTVAVSRTDTGATLIQTTTKLYVNSEN